MCHRGKLLIARDRGGGRQHTDWQTWGQSQRKCHTSNSQLCVQHHLIYIFVALTCTCMQRRSNSHKLFWHIRRVRIDPLISGWTSRGDCLGRGNSDDLGGTESDPVRGSGGDGGARDRTINNCVCLGTHRNAVRGRGGDQGGGSGGHSRTRYDGVRGHGGGRVGISGSGGRGRIRCDEILGCGGGENFGGIGICQIMRVVGTLDVKLGSSYD
jgi:hypothetical protein